MADPEVTLLWEKRGKGWTMALSHIMPGDRFAIAAQLDSGESNGWMGMMGREEAAGLAKALTTRSETQMTDNELIDAQVRGVRERAAEMPGVDPDQAEREFRVTLKMASEECGFNGESHHLPMPHEDKVRCKTCELEWSIPSANDFQEFLDTPSPYDHMSDDPAIRARAASTDWAAEGKKPETVDIRPSAMSFANGFIASLFPEEPHRPEDEASECVILSFPFDFGRGRMIVQKLGEGAFGVCIGSEFLWQTDQAQYRLSGTGVYLDPPAVVRLIVFLAGAGEPKPEPKPMTRTEATGVLLLHKQWAANGARMPLPEVDFLERVREADQILAPPVESKGDG